MLYRIKQGISFLHKNGIKATAKKTIWFLRSQCKCKPIGIFKFYAFADYIHYLEDYNKSLKNGTNQDFVEKTTDYFVRQKGDSKIIAWYLPQYYRIDVNDKFHGTGFTEWTNSSQAIPLFKGHYQPHIPYDVGYYNLLLPETMERQIVLAKQYGIYGFCFHWYWFSGKRTMEKPVEMFLEHKEFDMPFCLNWATENWTTQWDGGNNDLIFEQKLEENDDEKFMADILPYLKDRRYIKIEGKPVLIIYICTIFEKQRFRTLLSNFRKISRENDIPDLYIMICNSRNFDEDVTEWGADALVEFPPASLNVDRWNPRGYLNHNFKGHIFDFEDFIINRKYLSTYKNKNIFRSALTSFDNSARKAYKHDCVIFQGATPLTYKTWLKDIMAENKNKHGEHDNIVFVNSWNEWAEGSHLEPDIRYGYAYLQATKEALEEVRVDEHIIDRKIYTCLTQNEKITFYIHCIESLGDIVACEPISRYLKEKVSDSKIIWIVKKEFQRLIEFNPNIDKIVTVNILSDSINFIKKKSKEKNSIIIDCHYDFRRSSITHEVHRNTNNPAINEQTYFYYGSILSSFCLSAGLPKLNTAPRFYLDPNLNRDERLPEKYMVIHCRSAEACKDWSKKNWNLLVRELSKQGFNIIELGLEPLISGNVNNYYDFTFEHDLQKIAKIISGAELFIGIDSGFAHIANCLNIYGILIFGAYKNFTYYMPYSGNYADGINSEIIYADTGSAKNVKVKCVMEALERWKNKIPSRCGSCVW